MSESVSESLTHNSMPAVLCHLYILQSRMQGLKADSAEKSSFCTLKQVSAVGLKVYKHTHSVSPKPLLWLSLE